MSGYEGAGTDMGDSGPDGPDGANVGFGYQWGGSDVADSSIGISVASSGTGLSLGSSGLGLSASPGPGLSLAAPSSPGLSASPSQVADFGLSNAPSLDMATTGAVQSAAAQLAISEAASASAKAAADAKLASTVKTGVSLVPGGGLLVAAVEFFGNLFDAIGSQFGGGSTPSAGTSPAPDLFAGSDGPPDAGFTGGAPVLGFGGSVVNNVPQTITGGSGVAPGLVGYAPGGGLQYGAGFIAQPGAQQQTGLAPLALLAGLASLLFMG